MPKVYIAGPMQGKPQYNYPAFDRARDYFLSLGWEVISPADMNRKDGFDPTQQDLIMGEDYLFPHEVPFCVKHPIRYAKEDFIRLALIRDKEIIVTCDYICLLPDWQESDGVKIELKHVLENGDTATPCLLLEGDTHIILGTVRQVLSIFKPKIMKFYQIKIGDFFKLTSKSYIQIKINETGAVALTDIGIGKVLILEENVMCQVIKVEVKEIL